MSQPSQVPPEQPTFDQAITQRLREAALDVLSAHPELRSVCVAFDYKGMLNDAKIVGGLWIGANGPVNELAAVFGSINQTLKLLEQQCSTAYAVVQHLRDQAGVLGKEIESRHATLQEVEAKIAQVRFDGSAGGRGSSEAEGHQGLPVRP